MAKALTEIGASLKDLPTTCWGIGGSLLLTEYGIVPRYNDIDIVVSSQFIEVIDERLSMLGTRTEGKPQEPFKSQHFIQYCISGIEVDLICSFRIQHEEGIFELKYDEQSISGFLSSEQEKIPMMALEDWFVLYQLIPLKRDKADLIEEYFRQHGINQPILLQRALSGALPYSVRACILALLRNL